jgi:hypothetical protein
MTLPNCDFRGKETVDRKNRQRWECVHPKMASGQPFVLVSAQNCVECSYCTFEPAKFLQGYAPTKPTRVSPETFEQRLNICDPCEFRAGNYCKRSGGCGLASSLQKKDFACPEGKFPRV